MSTENKGTTGMNEEKIPVMQMNSSYEAKIIIEHNAKMQIVYDTAKSNGLSYALLTYVAHFGIIGIPWVVK